MESDVQIICAFIGDMRILYLPNPMEEN